MDPSPAPAPAPAKDAGYVRPTRIAAQLAVSLALLGGAGLALGTWLRPQVLAWSEAFVAWAGGPGVALGIALPDAFPIPIPQDAVLLFGMVGGLGFPATVVWGTLGSLIGAVTGFHMGRWLARTGVYDALVARLGARAHAVVARYGAAGLTLSTVVPVLPFGACCWAVGAMGMRLPLFLLVIQLRWLRVGGYLWLVSSGFLAGAD
jgi:membrane protein YqaA with SNARE-associated domain